MAACTSVMAIKNPSITPSTEPRAISRRIGASLRTVRPEISTTTGWVLVGERLPEPAGDGGGVGDRCSDDDGVGAGVERGAGLLGGVHPTLGHDGQAGEVGDQVGQEVQVGTGCK